MNVLFTTQHHPAIPGECLNAIDAIDAIDAIEWLSGQ